MINLKVLSAAAVLALTLPALTPTASFAQGGPQQQRGSGAPGGGRAAGTAPSVASSPRFVGAAPNMPGSPRFVGAAPNMAGSPRFVGAAPNMAGSPRFAGASPNVGAAPGIQGVGPRYGGGHYGHDHDGDHDHHHGHGGFFPGVVIGGALASGPYYNDGYYAGTPYYDAPYDNGGSVVEAAPPGDDDGVAYCMQRYRSYDPDSGTFLGNDGLRHPCP
jgi:hypothetical protein